MGWAFDNRKYLFFLLLIPVLWFLIIQYGRWKEKRKNAFAERAFQQDLFEKKGKYRYFFTLLYLLSLVFLIFAIADLRMGNQQVKTKHQVTNVVLMLDVSNSMNAEDVKPSRLDRERQIVLEMLKGLQGDRVGVVIFAGEAVSIMPLTEDFDAISDYVSGLQTTAVKRQGTDFLMAMQQTAALYQNSSAIGRNAVMISDGEDNEGHTGDAISLAKKFNIRVTTVGIGSDEGAPVPDYMFGQIMGYKMTPMGDPVVSKRQTKALRQMASDTGGNYIDGNSPDAGENAITSINKSSGQSTVETKSQSANHYYQWFLAVSLFLLFIIYLTNPKRDLNI